SGAVGTGFADNVLICDLRLEWITKCAFLVRMPTPVAVCTIVDGIHSTAFPDRLRDHQIIGIAVSGGVYLDRPSGDQLGLIAPVVTAKGIVHVDARCDVSACGIVECWQRV